MMWCKLCEQGIYWGVVFKRANLAGNYYWLPRVWHFTEPTRVRGAVGVSHSRLVDGKYGGLEMLGGGVNSPAAGVHPCVAHDESFVIFDSRRPGGQGGGGDLYVCFRNPDGSWGKVSSPVLLPIWEKPAETEKLRLPNWRITPYIAYQLH